MNDSKLKRTPRSSSAPRGRGSASPQVSRGASKELGDDVNRKLDYLLKKTKKLEDSLSGVRAENATLVEENRKTQECAVNLWESMKKDRDSMASIKGEVGNLRAKLDLINQRSQLVEQSHERGNAVDVGKISEEVFSRVHREFSTVVDEVVRACVKEQVEFLSKWTAKGGLEKETYLAEENKALRHELNLMKKQQVTMEESINDYHSSCMKLEKAFDKALDNSQDTARKQTHHLMEAFAKRMNDSVTFSIEAFKEDMAAKYDDTVHQLIDSSNDLQSRIADAEEQLSALDSKYFNAVEDAEIKISNLSDIVDNTKASVNEVLNEYEVVKEELTALSHPKTVADMSNESLRGIEERLCEEEDNIKSCLQILKEHRSDYTETISNLSTAGRQAKAFSIELSNKVQALESTTAKLSDTLKNITTENKNADSKMAKLEKENENMASKLSELEVPLPSSGKKGKKERKSGSSDRDGSIQALRSLKERMDIFEESVIDTVQEMIDSHESDAISALDERLQAVEARQDKYGELVRESVDTFHNAEIVPIVGSMKKVERLVENITSKLQASSSESLQFQKKSVNTTSIGFDAGEMNPTRNTTSSSSSPCPSNLVAQRHPLPSHPHPPPPSTSSATLTAGRDNVLAGVPDLNTLPNLRPPAIKANSSKKLQSSSNGILDDDSSAASVDSTSQSLRAKKQLHRKRFQAMVKRELCPPDS